MKDLLSALAGVAVIGVGIVLLDTLFGSTGGTSEKNEKSSTKSFTEGAADALFGNDRRSFDSNYTAGYNSWSDD